MPQTTAAVILLVQPDADSREMYADFLRFHGFVPVPIQRHAMDSPLPQRLTSL